MMKKITLLIFLAFSLNAFSQTYIIKRITLTQFPEKPFNKSTWDKINASYKPDIYVKIVSDSGKSFVTENKRVENVRQSDLPISWTPNMTFSGSESFRVYFYDYDSFNSDDLIGQAYIKITRTGDLYWTLEDTNEIGGYGQVRFYATVEYY